jgi:hypothetical protein
VEDSELLGFLHLPLGILKTLENTAFRKLDLLSSSDEECETPTLLGPLERADSNYWTTHVSITTAI